MPRAEMRTATRFKKLAMQEARDLKSPDQKARDRFPARAQFLRR
jgi:hypothetical protein